MNFTMEQYPESAQALRARLGGFVPKVAKVLGSGLGYLGDAVSYTHLTLPTNGDV